MAILAGTGLAAAGAVAWLACRDAGDSVDPLREVDRRIEATLPKDRGQRPDSDLTSIKAERFDRPLTVSLERLDIGDPTQEHTRIAFRGRAWTLPAGPRRETGTDDGHGSAEYDRVFR